MVRAILISGRLRDQQGARLLENIRSYFDDLADHDPGFLTLRPSAETDKKQHSAASPQSEYV
ncbi:MAG: hypothetical protein AAB225_09825 [Acidobacteriota bacterium]